MINDEQFIEWVTNNCGNHISQLQTLQVSREHFRWVYRVELQDGLLIEWVEHEIVPHRDVYRVVLNTGGVLVFELKSRYKQIVEFMTL